MKKTIALILCFVITSFLASAAPPIARTFWSQNGNSKLNGQPVPVGTVITANDPNGVLCGQYTVSTQGQFVFDCIGDDPDTPTDEGGQPGDIISFFMNGFPATVVSGSAEWLSGYQEVNIEATSGCTSNAQCDNGQYCDGAETCVSGVCQGGTPVSCSDNLFCTINERCNEATDSCVSDPRGCSDDLYCTVNERCDENLDTCASDQRTCSDSLYCTINERCNEDSDQCISDPRDCSANNKSAIATCTYNPDNNPYTWDSALAFTSACDEGQDICTTLTQTLTHQCRDNNPNDGVNANQCGAPCDQNSDCACAADACIDADSDGSLDDYADYPQYGSCLNDCSCSIGTAQGQPCSPTITMNDARCGGCTTDAQCDNSQYCDGAERCVSGSCQKGTPIVCSDNSFCTINERCNEDSDQCISDPRDCSANNKSAIATCTNNPDNNPFTWDSALAFTSACDEGQDICTTLTQTPTHQCRDNNPNDGVNGNTCNAPCDQNSDCACAADTCIDADQDGRLDDYADYPQYGSCLNDCSCSTGTAQGQPCSPTITMNDARCATCTTDADCNNNIYCDGAETCVNGACQAGTPINCNDNVACTVDSCNEATDSCDNTPNNALCDDAQYCNGQETCHAVNGCQAGTPIDCSANNLPAIATCTNNPDNNPFTWDSAALFTSTCDETNDRCTTETQTLTHQCRDNNPNDGVNGNQCGAACDQNSDCDDSDPTTIDVCTNACTCVNTREICNNGIDDEGDGLIDCKDPDCAGQQGPNNAICCQNNDNCNQLDDECADGACTNNQCQQNFKPATTVCRQKDGDCDIEEKCAGNNAKCPADQVEPAAKVCRPSASNCDVAENCDGANKACPADSFKPIGTDCGICAACNNLGTCIYDETQDIDCACPADNCTDANNDGIIGAYNDYNIGECQAINICNSCGPTITEPDTKCKTTMKIPIDEGVSMFSLPLIPDTQKTFNNIQNGCTFTGGIQNGIAYWDPLKTEENKYVYIDANAQLYPGQGYFTTQQNDECEFTIEGYKFTAAYLGYLGTKNIYNGWNMIGAPSDPINNFDLVEGTCSVTSGPWGHDAAKYQYFRTQKLDPGKGYYIKTTNNCNLG